MLNDEIKTANTNEIEALKAKIAELEKKLRATNTGDWNTGDWNTGNCNTGCFNTTFSKIKLFNKDSDWDLNDWIDSKACQILENCPSSYLDWVELDDMTDKEKAEHPESETTGGFLKKVKPDKTPQEWWNALSEYDKKEALNLPNFDAEIFKEITKIDVNKEI